MFLLIGKEARLWISCLLPPASLLTAFFPTGHCTSHFALFSQRSPPSDPAAVHNSSTPASFTDTAFTIVELQNRGVCHPPCASITLLVNTGSPSYPKCTSDRLEIGRNTVDKEPLTPKLDGRHFRAPLPWRTPRSRAKHKRLKHFFCCKST